MLLRLSFERVRYLAMLGKSSTSGAFAKAGAALAAYKTSASCYNPAPSRTWDLIQY